MTPEDKNRFDALMRLCDFRYERWKNRRSYEWRVSLGLWALMAASIHYYRDFPRPASPFISLMILIVVVLVHLWWVHFNLISNQKDINHAFYYSDRARQVLGEGKTPPNEEQGPDGKWGGLTEKQNRCGAFLREPPCQVEIGTTVILALILGYLLRS